MQGVTERLPISSTVHLRVLPGLLGWPDPGFQFFTRIHRCAKINWKQAPATNSNASH